jgi:hypothetical protein
MPATAIVSTPNGYYYSNGTKVKSVPNGVVRITPIGTRTCDKRN